MASPYAVPIPNRRSIPMFGFIVGRCVSVTCALAAVFSLVVSVMCFTDGQAGRGVYFAAFVVILSAQSLGVWITTNEYRARQRARESAG